MTLAQDRHAPAEPACAPSLSDAFLVAKRRGMKSKMRNLITDVPGLTVGNAEDFRARSGVTAVLPDQPAVAAIDIRGGGTGTRDVEALSPDGTVEHVDAVLLSGGSAFGLDASGGMMSWLTARGRGFAIAGTRVPIVPQAVLFDLANGGDKDWGPEPPYWTLGYRAADATDRIFVLGNAGAGLGAKAGSLKGGLGSASQVIADSGVAVGALAAVNCVGEVVIPGTDVFYAWDMEIGAEFGGRRPGRLFDPAIVRLAGRPQAGENTTIAVVATNAILTRVQAKRLAIMAQTGLGRAIRPSHTPLDGDIVFALSTGQKELGDPRHDLVILGGHAANCLARAIARGVYEAQSLGDMTAYCERFG